MTAWEIWTGPLYGQHPVVLVSNAQRIKRTGRVVVLKCTSLRSGDPWQPDALQAVLDREDGLNWRTRVDCDLLFTLDKETLHTKRGEVSWERRRDISRKIVLSLALVS